MTPIIASFAFLVLCLIVDLFERARHLKYHLLRQEHEHEEGELE
jgi:hypothetical protein